MSRRNSRIPSWFLHGFAGFVGAIVAIVLCAVLLLSGAGHSYSGGAAMDSMTATGGSGINSIHTSFGSASKGDFGFSNGGDMYDAAPPLNQETSAPQDAPNGNTLQSDRKLIRTVRVEAETQEYDKYLDWINEEIAVCGGYTEDIEQGTLYNDRRYASITIRVPADKLDAMLSFLDECGNVTYKRESVQDVTENYTDVETHISSIEIERDRLQELLAMAETLDDILSIEDRLTYVRYELESYERQKKSYDSQIDYSTIELSVSEVIVYSEPEPEGFFARCAEGIKDNFHAVCIFFEGLAIWVISHIPALAVTAIILALLIFCIKKIRRKHHKDDEPRGGGTTTGGMTSEEEDSEDGKGDGHSGVFLRRCSNVGSHH